MSVIVAMVAWITAVEDVVAVAMVGGGGGGLESENVRWWRLYE